jgi:hypothetical protein
MRESGCQINRTHNPFEETHWVSRLRENLTSGSYGEGLETDQDCLTPRQSFTRQLFFKWIKQNLRVKSFLGTSMNAVKTQLWIALCAYLVLSFLKFQSKIGASLQRMLRILQLNLFERRDLQELFFPPRRKLSLCDRQLDLI